MASISGLREVGHIDCAGGGQIRVDGTTAYVGHMAAPFGTSIFDISDPADPRLLAEIGMPPGSHSHKVRAQDGLMVVNHERLGGPQTEGFEGGLGIYDVEDPANPRHIVNWETWGKGVHRFDLPSSFVTHTQRYPPATLSMCPVTMDAASDARKMAGPTISRGSPRRSIGVRAAMNSLV